MGSKFKDLFIKSEEINHEESKIQQPTNVSSPVFHEVVITPPTTTPPITTGSSVQPDPGIIAKLQQVVIGKNLPGPDYLEILSSAKSLENYIPDETRRFEAAFSLLRQQYSGSNLTKQTIINSIDTYIGIVETERKSGLSACISERHERLDSKIEEINRLQSSLSEIDKQIAALSEKKINAVSRINQLESERKEAEAQISTKEAVFNSSVDQFIGHLNEDKNKISSLNI